MFTRHTRFVCISIQVQSVLPASSLTAVVARRSISSVTSRAGGGVVSKDGAEFLAELSAFIFVKIRPLASVVVKYIMGRLYKLFNCLIGHGRSSDLAIAENARTASAHAIAGLPIPAGPRVGVVQSPGEGDR